MRRKTACLPQVGEVHRGLGHLSLEYHLNARPGAKLDLSDALRDAGHDIPQRQALPTFHSCQAFELSGTSEFPAARPRRTVSCICLRPCLVILTRRSQSSPH